MLRKNMTEAEKILWSKIRRKQLKGYQFYRQRVIGNYIVDFLCPKARLVIEVDGGQHSPFIQRGRRNNCHFWEMHHPPPLEKEGGGGFDERWLKLVA